MDNDNTPKWETALESIIDSIDESSAYITAVESYLTNNSDSTEECFGKDVEVPNPKSSNFEMSGGQNVGRQKIPEIHFPSNLRMKTPKLENRKSFKTTRSHKYDYVLSPVGEYIRNSASAKVIKRKTPLGQIQCPQNKLILNRLSKKSAMAERAANFNVDESEKENVRSSLMNNAFLE